MQTKISSEAEHKKQNIFQRALSASHQDKAQTSSNKNERKSRVRSKFILHAHSTWKHVNKPGFVQMPDNTM